MLNSMEKNINVSITHAMIFGIDLTLNLMFGMVIAPYNRLQPISWQTRLSDHIPKGDSYCCRHHSHLGFNKRCSNQAYDCKDEFPYGTCLYAPSERRMYPPFIWQKIERIEQLYAHGIEQIDNYVAGITYHESPQKSVA